MAILRSDARPGMRDSVRDLVCRLACLALATLLVITSAAAQERTLRALALIGPKSVDPVYATTTGEYSLAVQLFEGLYTVDDKGKSIFGQAQSLKISDDQRHYTLTLRPDIFWSNGDPVTAADFVLTFRRLVDPAIKAYAKPSYLITPILGARDIVAGKASPETLGVRAPDERTLEFELAAPSPFFREILNFPALVPTPSRVYARLGERWATDGFVSNGAYTLGIENRTAPSPYAHLRLNKNDRYYNARSVYFEHIELMFESKRDGVALLSEGKVDINSQYSGERIEWLTETLGAHVTKSESYYTSYIAFNMKDPVVRDVRVRRALALMADIDMITPRIDPLGVPAQTFSTPMERAGWQPAKRGYQSLPQAERKAQALALLRAAGHSGETPLRLDITTNAAAVNERIIAALRESWSAIGVELNSTSLPGGEHYKNLAAGRFQLGRATWIQDIADPSDYLNLLHSGHVKNYAHWSNAAYDELLAKLPTTLDPGERVKLFVQLEALIAEEVPILPILHGAFSAVARKGLTGIVQHPQSMVFRYIRPTGSCPTCPSP